jgi:hypothetical protein
LKTLFNKVIKKGDIKMYLIITYNNDIVEEFALSLKSAQNLIQRLIKSGNVKEIKSGVKILYTSNKEYYNKVESLEFYAQATKDNCFGSGCIYEHGERSKRAIEKRHQVMHNEFIKMYEKASNLRKEIYRNVINIDDKKELLSRCIYVMRVMKAYISAKEKNIV